MILKTLRLLLTVSCCLLSLAVLAQETPPEQQLIKETEAMQTTIIHHNEREVSESKGDSKQSIQKEKAQQEKQTQNPINSKTKPIDTSEQTLVSQASTLREKDATPQVGKHVMSNMDAGSMIVSLFMVLGLILICTLVLKGFNFTQQGIRQLNVVSSLSLGSKERVVVVQAGQQQFLLGVTAQQVTLIERLEEPLDIPNVNHGELSKKVLSIFGK